MVLVRVVSGPGLPGPGVGLAAGWALLTGAGLSVAGPARTAAAAAGLDPLAWSGRTARVVGAGLAGLRPVPTPAPARSMEALVVRAPGVPEDAVRPADSGAFAAGGLAGWALAALLDQLLLSD